MFGSPSPIDHNLILTGYSGPGQYAVARRVGERLRMPLIDFAARFEERNAMPADEMRAVYGDSRTKTLEGDLVSEIALVRGSVIHISGETLMHGDHHALLSGTGPVICIVATLDAVLQRLHLALGSRYHNPRERSLALGMVEREWAIRKQSDITEIDTSVLDETAVVEAVCTTWRRITGVIDWR